MASEDESEKFEKDVHVQVLRENNDLDEGNVDSSDRDDENIVHIRICFPVIGCIAIPFDKQRVIKKLGGTDSGPCQKVS